MRRPSNPLALAVLTLLHERPMHPYEMSTTLRERRKETSIRLNYGSLYSVVESLAKKGLIEATETVREGRRPERTIYDITDAGTDVMIEWLGELLREPKPQFTDFEAALSLIAALPPDEALQMLRSRLLDLRMRHTTYESMLASAPESFPRLFLIEAEYQGALLKAELEFCQQLVADIERGELSGLDAWRRMHELRDQGTPPEKVQQVIAEEFSHQLDWSPTDADD